MEVPTSDGLTIRCHKCGGLMALERFSDFFQFFSAWKCINCGEVWDYLIAANRRHSPSMAVLH